MFNRSSRLVVLAGLAVLSITLGLTGVGLAQAKAPRNVILLIGDGMGPEQIKSASLFAGGKEGSLFMETLPQKAEVVTCPAYHIPAASSAQAAKTPITDSAASATAYAVGQKAYNGVLSVALPGNGQPLPTVLEQFMAQGKGTGLVTSSYLTDATPAAFAAHVKARTMQAEIGAGMLKTGPNVLLGGKPEKTMSAADGKAAGYQVVTNRDELKAVKPAPGGKLLGLFGSGPMCYEYDYFTKAKKDYDTQPHLTEMAMSALGILSTEPKGFFLMIEGGCIDKACHGNKLPQAVYDTLEFDKTVKEVAAWAARRDDTLILVVADHETGGLKVTQGNGQGKLPEVAWSTKGHSGANVRLFASGPGSLAVKGTLDNTDLFRLMTGTFTSPTTYKPTPATSSAGEAPALKGD